MLPELSEIKQKRKQFGLTQKELAEKSGLSQSLVSKIEAGILVPNFENAKKIFDCLSSLKQEKELKASEIMKKHIYSIGLEESIGNAVKLMTKHAISQLPVIDGEKVLGTVSEKSILSKIHSMHESKNLKKIKVEEIMEESMPIVQEATPLSAIAELLEYSAGVLVAKKGKITGIITKSDLLKASVKK